MSYMLFGQEVERSGTSSGQSSAGTCFDQVPGSAATAC
jgi:hypothetical protein